MPEGGPAVALSRLDQLVREFGDPRCRMSAVCVDLTRHGRGFSLTAARVGDGASFLALRVRGGRRRGPVPIWSLGTGDGVDRTG